MTIAFGTALLIVSLVVLVLVVQILRRLALAPGDDIKGLLGTELRAAREESARQARELRAEVAAAQDKANEALVRTVTALGADQKDLLAKQTQASREAGDATRTALDAQREKVHTQLLEIQKANQAQSELVRAAVATQLRQLSEDQRKQLGEVVATLQALTTSNRTEQEKCRQTLDERFTQIQQSNEKKLEEMRQTVDEKLQTTLERRLGESFKLVSERLEAVQRGLGEMQTLATGVGDLKRVLTNVKERGTWGEYRLSEILEQILTPDQFGRNVNVGEGREHVEFAIRLPGRSAGESLPVWLPIDSKYPKEDYERLIDASARADADGVRDATDAIAKSVRLCAKEISTKYINPPMTTDIAVMFLPTEGLYAEILRQPGLCDELQQKYRVLPAGPTTLAALLNSLRVGFQTLVIEKRAHEVWTVLGAVKTEFSKFGEILDRAKKQMNTALKTLDESTVRTRAMERKLRAVEQLPAPEAEALLALPPATTADLREEPVDVEEPT